MSRRDWKIFLDFLFEGQAITDTDIAGIKWAAARIAELEAGALNGRQKEIVIALCKQKQHFCCGELHRECNKIIAALQEDKQG